MMNPRNEMIVKDGRIRTGSVASCRPAKGGYNVTYAVRPLLEYFRDVAALNPLTSDDGTKLLLRQYEQVNFIDTRSAAAAYLNPEKRPLSQAGSPAPLIYPFGTNASQQMAMSEAFTHQISVIQGPPGTGKTQTILNIIANILCQGKTALVVSNNNSALENVAQKMNSRGLGFVSAMLGSRENRNEFFRICDTEKAIPEDIDSWCSDSAGDPRFIGSIQRTAEDLRQIFRWQEEMARMREELEELKTERRHFEEEVWQEQRLSGGEVEALTLRRKRSSETLLRLWNEVQDSAGHTPQGFLARMAEPVRWLFCRMRLKLLFRGLSESLRRPDLLRLIPVIQRYYYEARCNEISTTISRLKAELTSRDTDGMLRTLTDKSTTYLRHKLGKRYSKGHSRGHVRHLDAAFVGEFPIVLSTTFSARANFGSKVLFDYVIMDEASQVSPETGTLALMCGRNAVIVGDSMQLPNVVGDNMKRVLEQIGKDHGIAPGYDCSKLSFLESVCRVFPNAPQTLLREHYRCHPKIIGFCNRKFYGGSLIVMTRDNGEENAMQVIRTAPGHHTRGHYSQREIDVICEEVLPEIAREYQDIGIISPYNAQVDRLAGRLPQLEVATVHKFQGRDKDVIVLSATDDVVTEFSDDPNLLNVAVSRAKCRFCLVISGNEQPAGNISDLVSYIRYNNCEVTQSSLHSVFDLLYSQYTQERIAYLRGHSRISEYDSENLAYGTLSRTIASHPEFSCLGVVCHYPLRRLIRDFSLMEDPEDRLYASRSGTHLDFLIYNRVGRQPVLAVEVDGYNYHKAGTEQSLRDERKNRILALYGIPLLRVGVNQIFNESTVAARLAEVMHLQF